MNIIPSELKINSIIEHTKEPQYGELTLILGCMFAGKSTELIRQIRRYRSIGLNVLIIKHIIDDRYIENSITTHDKESIESININNLNIIWDKYLEFYLNADLIVIEEAQFFDEIYDFTLETLEVYKKNVIIAGLDGNYLRQPFLNGELLKLIPIAENVYKLHGFCHICHKKASFTKRIIKLDDEQNNEIIVGGKETYIPVCRNHYIN